MIERFAGNYKQETEVPNSVTHGRVLEDDEGGFTRSWQADQSVYHVEANEGEEEFSG